MAPSAPLEGVGDRNGGDGGAAGEGSLEAATEQRRVGEGTGRIVNDDDLSLGAGERERRAHRILTLVAAGSNFDRDLEAGARHLIASALLHAGRNRNDDFGYLRQFRQRREGIVQDRAAMELDERLGLADSKSDSATGCNYDDRGNHRMAPAT